MFAEFLAVLAQRRSLGGWQMARGQEMREKRRDSGLNRARGGWCRAQARLQSALEKSGSQSVSAFS
jgi:hypothetical protein